MAPRRLRCFASLSAVALGAAVWAASPSDASAQVRAPAQQRYQIPSQGQPYGPPPQAPPPQAPPAYYAQPAGPPYVVHDWSPDVPAPDGYDLRTSANGELIGYGMAMLSIGYVTSVVIGLVAVQGSSSSRADNWAPLFIPVGGPFAAIGTLGASSAETGVLLGDGIVQTGGLIAIIVGAIQTRYRVVRTEFGTSAGPPVEVMPVVGAERSGVRARLSF